MLISLMKSRDLFFLLIKNAESFLKEGDYEHAEQCIRGAKAYCEKYDYLEKFLVIGLFGKLYRAQGKQKEAEKHYRNAMLMIMCASSPPDTISLREELYTLFYQIFALIKQSDQKYEDTLVHFVSWMGSGTEFIMPYLHDYAGKFCRQWRYEHSLYIWEFIKEVYVRAGDEEKVQECLTAIKRVEKAWDTWPHVCLN